MLHEILKVLWREDCAARAKSLKKKLENNKEVTEDVVNFLSKHDGNTRDHNFDSLISEFCQQFCQQLTKSD